MKKPRFSTFHFGTGKEKQEASCCGFHKSFGGCGEDCLTREGQVLPLWADSLAFLAGHLVDEAVAAKQA